MTTQTIPIPVEVREALDSLAENLLASAPFRRFDDCGERLMTDPQAQPLWRNLRRLEEHLRSAQASGQVSADDTSNYRQAHAAAKSNPIIADFWQAQASVQESLQATNRDISAALGVDFGQLARHAGCC